MDKTKIDWCDSTWNPITGCLHGCEYCYARRIAKRFDGGKKLKYGIRTELHDPATIGGIASPYPYGFTPTFHRYRLNDYIDKKGRNIFVCSMADLFGEWVPDEWIEEVFKTCGEAPQHNYLFLTKNPWRYVELQRAGKLIERDNMWYGASATDENSLKEAASAFAHINYGMKTFLSIEPIFEDIALTKTWKDCVAIPYMDWVIIGAETGRRKDKIVPDRAWIKNIVNGCRKSDIPVFMKLSLTDIWGEPLIQEFPKEFLIHE